MTKLRIHADEWSKDRGYSVAFTWASDEDPNPQEEAESLKYLEQLFGLPAEITEHEETATSGEFKHWVSPEKLKEIYDYCTGRNSDGTLILPTGVEVHFFAVEGHFGRESPTDLEDWPDKFNMQDKQDSEFCTCDGPGKGFSLGRKNFVNCTKCGKPKPPDWEGEFERTGTRVHAQFNDDGDDKEHDPVALLNMLIEEITNGASGSMEINMLEMLSDMLTNEGSDDVAVYIALAQQSLEAQDIPTTLEILDQALTML